MKNLTRNRILSDYKEVHEILKLADKYGLKILYYGAHETYKTKAEVMHSKEYKSLSGNILVGIKETKLELTTKYYRYKELTKKGLAPCTWIFNLNEEHDIEITGQKAFMEQQRHFKIKNVKEDTTLFNFLHRYFDEETGKFVCSASPIIDYNKDYNKQELTECYEYDLNSAYYSIMLDKIPDTNSWRLTTKLKEGEVGFMLDDQLKLIEKPGLYVDIAFKLMDSPEGIKEYGQKYYDIKKSSTGRTKLEAKAYLNLPIGYCQRFNPFIRSYVVHKCNSKIKSLLDENSLFWNTDAIFSKVRRPDLEIGDNIGQWKEVKIDRLAYNGNNYQVNYEHPTYRGVPKQWFKQFELDNGRPWDILKDTLPPAKNIWKFDKKQLKVIKEQ